MQLSPLRCWLLNSCFLFSLLVSKPTAAQIIPDSTLPNNSIVAPNCTNCEVTGGTTVGNNLFHSFEQFSIPTDGTASFNNVRTIENIISRVTGQFISNVDGLIRANGTANLFLLNPNGIIFGPNASLDIGGSFLATTADRIDFADGTQFRGDGTQSSPLLTVSVPTGLQFGQTPGIISNQSLAPLVNRRGNPILDDDGNPIPYGLQVRPGNTLALVGGSITLPGGYLTALGGRIELGSVASPGLVSLTPTKQGWALDYDGIQNFQDISLSEEAYVDASGDTGGDIQIQGRRVTLTEGSQVVSVSYAEGQAGEFRVSASELVELSGTSADGEIPTGLFNEVEEEATGEGGTLTIETRRLIVQGGAQISTATYGIGRGVDLTIKASDSVELLGNSLDGRLPSGLFARSNQEGDGGTLSIETGRLIVQGGAKVSTDTKGAGRAGDLIVRASNSVEVVGRTPNQEDASGLFAQVREGATGDGGDLTIDTRQLTVLGGAQIATNTFSLGRGGNLIINAFDTVLLSGTAPISRSGNISGVLVSAERGATGDAGNLIINTGLLTIEDGARISADNFGIGQGGTATLNVQQLVVRDRGTIRAASFNEGPAGDLNITTNSLNVQDGAEVTVSGLSSGPAGNLTITANSIALDRGRLTGETQTGSGANISLQNVDLLFMRNQSLISAQAFNNGDGGNITINTGNGFIVAVPDQDSDIIANAFEGRGGNINITAQSLFGIEERRAIQGNGTNDIDASSEFGLNGTITINRPDVDPSRGLANLSTEVVDASNLIASGCGQAVAQRQSQFVVTGRGGLPDNPSEALSSDTVWSDLRLPTIATRTRSVEPTATEPTNSTPKQLVEAQGWVINNNGKVVLTAQAVPVVPHSAWQTTTTCPTQSGLTHSPP